MPKISDPWDHHDWSSPSYVSRWAERQDHREADREDIFLLIAKILPQDQEANIKILDAGAGYGALARFLLDYFPNATTVCQDGSEEMAKLGRQRMKPLKGRVKYVLCDFSKPGWSRKIKGPFDAVVSSIAIHNVRSPAIIRAIYGEIFSLVKTGGCFLNFDRMVPSKKDQLKWLKEAGFGNVKCYWDGGKRAVLGGFNDK
ncbi:MAG: class I SAM-dependent methyltransferase [Deltaproteobacteria bacterium]|nr:class I SAM-dependent methyltransferase [Deltaproteobacteria bacterium]